MVSRPEKIYPPLAGGGVDDSCRHCTSQALEDPRRRTIGDRRSDAGAVKEEPMVIGSVSYQGFIVSIAAALLILYISFIGEHHLGGTVNPPADSHHGHSSVSASAADAGAIVEEVASMPSMPGTHHSRPRAAVAESLRGAVRGVDIIDSAAEVTTAASASAGREWERDLEVEGLPPLLPRARALSDLDQSVVDHGEKGSRFLPVSADVRDPGDVQMNHRQTREMLKGHPRCFIHDGIHRCHANVFFFGVSKCGTTSLAHWMGHHPALRWIGNIHYPTRQVGEAHIFDTSIDNWHSIIKSGKHGEWGVTTPEATASDVVVDYTPHYSIVAEVPFRIWERYGKKAFDGSTKYVVLLREPVARTISSWEFKFDLRSIGASSIAEFAEGRPLAKALSDGRRGVTQLLECREGHPELMKKNLSTTFKLDLIRCRPSKYMDKNLYVSHVGKSMYALQLERWFTLFGRQNIKAIFLEEMAADPLGTLQTVFEFIGLDLLEKKGENDISSREDWERVVKLRHNQTTNKKKNILHEQVTPELVQELRDFFAPHNSMLEELLGRALPDNWSTSSRA